jgi:hypothetical protein
MDNVVNKIKTMSAALAAANRAKADNVAGDKQ